ERAKERFTSVKGDIQAKEAEIAAREEALGRLPALRQQLGGLDEERKQRGARVAQLQAALEAGSKEMQDLEAKHERWVRSSAALEDRSLRVKALGARGAEVRGQGQIAAKLEPERAALVRELSEEQARAEKALSRVHEKVASIDADSFVLTEYKRQLEQLKDDLRREADESHRLLQPLDDAKIEALRQLDAVPFTELDGKRLVLVGESVAEKAGKRKRLDELTILLRQVGDVSARLADFAVQRKSLEAERTSLEAELAGLRSLEEAFGAAKAKIET